MTWRFPLWGEGLLNFSFCVPFFHAHYPPLQPQLWLLSLHANLSAVIVAGSVATGYSPRIMLLNLLVILLRLLAALLWHPRRLCPLWEVLYITKGLCSEGQGLPGCFFDIIKVSLEWCELSITNSFSAADDSSAQVISAWCFFCSFLRF